MDTRFAGETIEPNGFVSKFRGPGCMATYLVAHPDERGAVFVTDYTSGKMVSPDAALFEHLRSNPSFSAGIDAWWTEPFSAGEFRVDRPFFDLPNVLGSPHNSALVPGILEHAARMATENVARYLRGEPVRGVVNREDYPGQP